VTEVDIRMRCDVGFDFLPIVLVVADLLAIAANGQQSLQHRHFGKGGFEFAHAVGPLPLQRDHAFADANPGAQFLSIERFGDEIVGGAFQTNDDILRPILDGEQKDVSGLLANKITRLLANRGAVHPRHDPIDNRQLGGVLALEDLPSGLAIARDDHVVAPFSQHSFEHRPTDGIVFGNENPHVNLFPSADD